MAQADMCLPNRAELIARHGSSGAVSSTIADWRIAKQHLLRLAERSWVIELSDVFIAAMYSPMVGYA